MARHWLRRYCYRRASSDVSPSRKYSIFHRVSPKRARCSAGLQTSPMITAIVLVKADPKMIPQCATKLAGIDGVSQVYSVSGEWDLVAIVEVTDYEGVATVVTEHISAVPGLRSTQTLTAFRAYSKKDLEQAWDIGLE